MRDKDTGRFMKPSAPPQRPADQVLASYPDCGTIFRPVWLGGYGRLTMVDEQKFRNNYQRCSIKEQMSLCRRVTKYNGLVRPVVRLRAASYGAGFQLLSGKKSAPVVKSFSPMMRSAMLESLTTSNVVALWRTGQPNPPISILNSEQVYYTSVGGIEKITLSISQDPVVVAEKNPDVIDAYKRNLGEKMYNAYRTGGNVTITSGFDAEWDFRVMTDGKWEGKFEVPELIGLLDTIDFLELMGVGDWNLAWFRKDVIRTIKKGYKGTGNNGIANEVNMTDPEKEAIGDGFSKLKGNSNMPMNHDVDPGYLIVPPDPFDPKQIKSAIDRFLAYAGIEGVVQLGSFSQQNGAAPSLMRNHRAAAFDMRERMETFVDSILEADEFKALVSKGGKCDWSVKSLYSVDEIMAMVSGTADGIASPQTRRGWLDLDDAEESRLMQDAHKRKEDFTPPFEGKQGLLSDQTPPGKNDGGKGGRPGGSAPV